MISDEEAKKLRDKVKELEEEVERLKKIEKEFEEFKAKHAITVENLKKALKIKADSNKTPNHIGAQKGHKAYLIRIP